MLHLCFALRWFKDSLAGARQQRDGRYWKYRRNTPNLPRVRRWNNIPSPLFSRFPSHNSPPCTWARLFRRSVSLLLCSSALPALIFPPSAANSATLLPLRSSTYKTSLPTPTRVVVLVIGLGLETIPRGLFVASDWEALWLGLVLFSDWTNLEVLVKTSQDSANGAMTDI